LRCLRASGGSAARYALTCTEGRILERIAESSRRVT
jgi:hypothetical protein